MCESFDLILKNLLWICIIWIQNKEKIKEKEYAKLLNLKVEQTWIILGNTLDLRHKLMQQLLTGNFLSFCFWTNLHILHEWTFTGEAQTKTQVENTSTRSQIWVIVIHSEDFILVESVQFSFPTFHKMHFKAVHLLCSAVKEETSLELCNKLNKEMFSHTKFLIKKGEKGRLKIQFLCTVISKGALRKFI